MLAAGCTPEFCCHSLPFGWPIHSGCGGGAATFVLFVGVGGFDNALEVCLCLVVVGFDVGQMLLPRQHFLLVKAIAVVDLLQVKLEFVVIGNGDVRSHKGALVVVKVLPEHGEVFVSHLE